MSTSAPSSCPVPHNSANKIDKNACPVSHSSIPTTHKSTSENVCPVSHSSALMDPGYKSVCGYDKNSPNLPVKDSNISDPNYHYIFPSTIQSTNNNGNSEDGSYWIGPSANQLSRALERKGKANNITTEDVKVVAAIHSVVTETTWKGILEYENLHKECLKPTLTRFEGKWDTLSPKAQFLHFFGYLFID